MSLVALWSSETRINGFFRSLGRRLKREYEKAWLFTWKTFPCMGTIDCILCFATIELEFEKSWILQYIFPYEASICLQWNCIPAREHLKRCRKLAHLFQACKKSSRWFHLSVCCKIVQLLFLDPSLS